MTPNDGCSGIEPEQLPGRPVARLGMQFVSSHCQATGGEPEFTTAHDKCVGTVDYIWYCPQGTGGLRADVTAVLLSPSREALKRGFVYGSLSRVSCIVCLSTYPLSICDIVMWVCSCRHRLPSSIVASDHLPQVSELLIWKSD
jgi:hypothetical protein